MRPPSWLSLLLGWLVMTGLLARSGSHFKEPTPLFGPEKGVDPVSGGLPATPREWRGLVGIGPRRALDLARAQWECGTRPFDLGAVPGIGPVTEGRVRAFLASRGAYTGQDHGPDPERDSPGTP